MKTRNTIIIILSLVIVLFMLLAWRLFYLQHYNTDRYRRDSMRQQLAIVTEKSQRGAIIDRKGRLLAASNKIETVYIDPEIVPDIEIIKETADRLHPILGIGGHVICRIIDETASRRFVKIKVGITPEERKEIKEARLPGVDIQSSWKRYYPSGVLCSHVIGFVGVDKNVRAGIELKYDSQLSGSKGRKSFFVDASGLPIGQTESGEGVSDGLSLILTIDMTIQEFTRTALIKQLKAYQAESAVGIVMDPWTGAILAMVSVPDYDPAKFGSASSATLRNRALTDPFEPGSIFKPIVAALALDAGVISRSEKIFCEDGYWGRYRIGEWASHKFANLNVREILVESSNIGMAKIGLKMGKDRVYKGLKLFGFGEKTGIDLPGEDSGIFRPVSKWSGWSVTRIPYGHEISVTALQIIRAYCILANGGSLVSPYLLTAIVDSTGEVKELSSEKTLAGVVINPEVANWIVRDALVGVVKDGTGKEAALENWQVFGKTGTANIARPGGGYDETNYTASFIGGAPAHKPEVVVLVAIRKPNKALGKGYSGGRVSAPVVREILEKTLTYLETHK